MRICTFELNGKPMSGFSIGANTFSAFSGIGTYVNKSIYACLPSQGPIPPGDYFIVDRESGRPKVVENYDFLAWGIVKVR